MMNLAMTNLAMSFDVVPGVLVGVMGPALGIIAAFAIAAVTYGFAALAASALRPTDRPTPAAPVAPAGPAARAEWEMTPTIAFMLRAACDESRSR
jgi:hypothetical protein